MRFGMLAAAAASCALTTPAGAAVITGTVGAGETVDFGTTLGASRTLFRFSADQTISGGYRFNQVLLYTNYDAKGNYIDGNDNLRNPTGFGGPAERFDLVYKDGPSRVSRGIYGYTLFSYDNGPLYFTVTNDGPLSANYRIEVLDIPGGVPEPATWGLMILGFGAISGALRTRKRQLQPA